METKTETKKEIVNNALIFKSCLKIEGFAIEALENLHEVKGLSSVCDDLRDLLNSCNAAKNLARSHFNNLTE